MAELFAADPVLTPPRGSAWGIPNFALVISEEVSGGWRSGAIIRDALSPAFYLRSISVPWSFVLARPWPSTRQSPIAFRRDQMSPARTSPARKLVVNWGWQPRDETTEQLTFFVRYQGPLWFWPTRKLAVRLGLKQQTPPRWRHTLSLMSEPIDWRPRRLDAAAAPESSPVHW